MSRERNQSDALRAADGDVSMQRRMPKSITLMSTGLAHGGAETQLVRLAISLKRRDWDVRVLSMCEPQAFTDELDKWRIPLATLSMRRGVPDPSALIRAVSLLRQWKPGVLTSFMFHANLLGRVAGRMAGVPVVVSSIRNENFGGPWREKVTRLTDWLADATTTNSRLAAEKLIERRVVPASRLSVIPNGIHVDDYVISEKVRLSMRRDLRVHDDEFMWLSAGRLEDQKDYPTLLAAMQLLITAGLHCRLFVAGQGPLLEDLEQTVRKSRLIPHVKFLGFRRDIPDLLSAADGFVLSSAWEGLPNVVMEAMAAGKPVVATRVGGVPELVQDGSTGFVVQPRDADALASAMRSLMSLSPPQLERMGSAARSRIMADYSVDAVTDRWEALFLGLLRQKGIGWT